ncbi:hypothetical protein LCGC14_2340520 [marine sediment metagenome]|uniref:Uncharacterized protein n=1 Tax=marine sediment metagenome TaxID=412755 RepID=A0A0F9CZP9_9ZZZZ
MNKFFYHLIRFIAVLAVIAAIHNKLTWDDSISNPDNGAYVIEAATYYDRQPYELKQWQFNRYYNF